MINVNNFSKEQIDNLRDIKASLLNTINCVDNTDNDLEKFIFFNRIIKASNLIICKNYSASVISRVQHSLITEPIFVSGSTTDMVSMTESNFIDIRKELLAIFCADLYEFASELISKDYFCKIELYDTSNNSKIEEVEENQVLSLGVRFTIRFSNAVITNDKVVIG